jgi:hypothetical protein
VASATPGTYAEVDILNHPGFVGEPLV